MSILVTGGAGYIGSAILERLVADGESVVCLDNFSTGHRDAVCGGVELVEGSILDGPCVLDTLRRFDVETVIHCAALSIVEESNRAPLAYFENNVAGAHVVLKGMVECGVTRFVLSSTAAVYGNPIEVPIRENHPIAPLNAYGRSKRMIEEMLEWHGRAYDFSYVSLRYFNAAGATIEHGEDHNPETHLIPIVLDVAQGRRTSIQIFGNDYPTADGTCVRDYIHISDLVDAHVRSVAHLRAGNPSEVFNLGTGSGHSVLEVVQAAERVTGRRVPHEVAPRRSGDAASLVASRDKAMDRLGWSPSRSAIAEVLVDAWRWKQVHPNGYTR